VSQVNRAQHLSPSFLLVWIGNNDVLPMATKTDPNAVTLDAPTFGQRIGRLLDALADTGADMAVANIPDVTGIAALRHAAPDVTTCSAAGVVTPVAPDDLLSVDLDPRLLPTPPCAKVLTADERAAIRAKIVAFNGQIAAAIADVQQRRGIGIAPVDMFALFDGARQGVDLNGDGTPDLTTGYLGGVFSLDGVHPTRTGQGLIANAFIDAINSRFAESIPRVDPMRLAARDPLVGNAFRPAGEPPFGLIGNSEVDGLDDFFQHVYDRIANGTDDLRKDLEDRARRLLDRFLKLF